MKSTNAIPSRNDGLGSRFDAIVLAIQKIIESRDESKILAVETAIDLANRVQSNGVNLTR